jgi:hypothetical protein
VFVRDRRAGTTERVSLGPQGRQANAQSSSGSLSDDGRFVVFGSVATNLVAGDTNGKVDIFLRDREAKRTTRVSVGAGGAQGKDHSDGGRISADGSCFRPGPRTWCPATPTRSGTFSCATAAPGRRAASASAQANGASLGAAISGDGGLASFDSGASNLWPGATNGLGDVFVARTH